MHAEFEVFASAKINIPHPIRKPEQHTRTLSAPRHTGLNVHGPRLLLVLRRSVRLGLGGGVCEALLEVGENVVDVLDADADADQVRGDARVGFRLVVELLGCVCQWCGVVGVLVLVVVCVVVCGWGSCVNDRCVNLPHVS